MMDEKEIKELRHKLKFREHEIQVMEKNYLKEVERCKKAEKEIAHWKQNSRYLTDDKEKLQKENQELKDDWLKYHEIIRNLDEWQPEYLRYEDHVFFAEMNNKYSEIVQPKPVTEGEPEIPPYEEAPPEENFWDDRTMAEKPVCEKCHGEKRIFYCFYCGTKRENKSVVYCTNCKSYLFGSTLCGDCSEHLPKKPVCETCNDTGECLKMECYGGNPIEVWGDCPDCNRSSGFSMTRTQP